MGYWVGFEDIAEDSKFFICFSNISLIPLIHFPFISEIHCLSYGMPKQYAIKKRSALMILIDDNEEVLQMWKTNVRRNGILASDFINEYL